MVKIDFFGIPIDTKKVWKQTKDTNFIDNNVEEVTSSITKENLCKLLKLNSSEVTWIQYDFKKQKLIIKYKPL